MLSDTSELLLKTSGVDGGCYQFKVENGKMTARCSEFEAHGDLELWQDRTTKQRTIMLRNAKITDKILAKIAYEAPMMDAHLINGGIMLFHGVKTLLTGQRPLSGSSIQNGMNKRYEEARQREHGDHRLDYEEIKKNLQIFPIYKDKTDLRIVKSSGIIPYYFVRAFNWSAPCGYSWCLGAVSRKKAEEWSKELQIPISTDD